MAALSISPTQSEILLLAPQERVSGLWVALSPYVFSTLSVWKSLKRSPPNSVMLSFCSRLSNWRVDKGLLGSQGLYIHGVHCGLETQGLYRHWGQLWRAVTTSTPSRIKKDWLKTKHLESFDLSFCKVEKEGCISGDSVLKSWERQGMTVIKSVGTSTSDLVGTIASVMTYIVFALLLAGVLTVKRDGRNPWVLLCFIMPHEPLRSCYSNFLQLRVV